jgi:hypothetical protein
VTDSAEDAVESHTIFTTSFSGLKAVLTSQGTWSGYALYATNERTAQLWGKSALPTLSWSQVVKAWTANYEAGNLDSSFGRRFRLLWLSDGQVRIVAAEDAIVLE